jgi:hypothetical protein
MIKVDFQKINNKRIKDGLSIDALAKMVGRETSTLTYFLKRGNQMQKDLRLVEDICEKLKINWRTIIK